MLGQNLSDVAETVLKGKSAVVNTLKRSTSTQQPNFTIEKKKKILNSKLAKGRKKVRVEINEIENRKTMGKNQ